MTREEQELLERAEEHENREQSEIEVDEQEDGLEVEFDREFWIKVI